MPAARCNACAQPLRGAQALRTIPSLGSPFSATYDFPILVSVLLLLLSMAEFNPSRRGVNMRNKLYAGILLLAAAASCSAQGMRAAGRPDPGTLQVQVIEGTVTAVNIAYGVQYPSIVVNGATIKVAPLWYLLENDFEVKAGDNVKVTAAPCNRTDATDLYALEIVNTTRNATIKLRDEDGVPLWGGGRGRRGGPNAMRAGTKARGGCIDPATVRTATGVVEAVNAGAGIQMPTLTLKTADGQTITMKIGPERILLAKDFELKPGDQVTAKYALATCTNEYVALELTNPAGVTVVLRTL
jgi:hypothetical protein